MANRIITAAVTGETIKLSNKTAGAAGSFNAVSLAFTFDSAWDGTTKKLYFFDAYGNNAVYRLLTTDLLVDGAYIVPIPAEPLAYAGEMTITIRGIDFATNGTTAERIIMSASTTMKVLSAIAPASDVAPVEPTPTQAEQLQGEIDGIKSTVTNAYASATAAANSATASATSATSAQTAQAASESARDLAVSAKTAAQTAETNAGTYATNASNSATAASGSATDANSAKAAAQTAQTAAAGSATDAQSAQTAAESARDAAVTAKTAAETARDAASSSKTAAATSESNAASSAAAAAASEAAAATSKTNAAASAQAAANSAAAAASSASAASSSASAADSAKTAAASSASEAATSASNAASSATAAATSATNADNARIAAQTAQTNADTSETNAETAAVNAKTAETNAVAAKNAAELALTHAPYIDDTTGNWFIWNATTSAYVDSRTYATGAKGDKGDKGDTGATGPQGIQGMQGAKGETGAKGDKGDKGDTGATGNGIASVVRTSGTGAPGTTDTYTITFTDSTTTTFGVYNGANGTGAGDMLAATYDPNGKNGDAFSMANMVEGTTNKIFTATERTKLSGIADNANNYVHPTTAGNKHIPSGGASGQILRYSADGTAVWGADNDTITTINGKTGAISKADIVALGIPAQDTVVDISGKVDKVSGKGLSTEDYTTAEKNKLAGIATGANNYTHPANHPPSIITQDASNRFVTDAEKSAWNGKANPPTAVTATLSTTWAGSGPYTQSVTVSGVTSTNNITVSLASTANEAQRKAARDALLSATAQATNSITVTADGDKPTIALPIQVLILGG